MPIPSNQVTHAECRVFGTIASAGADSKNTVTTFHFRRTAVVLPVVKADVDTAFQAAIGALIALCVPIRWGQTHNTIRWLNDATDAPTLFTHAVPGTIVGDSMPVHNYVYTLMKSGLRGKHYRGNYKIGPLGESATTTPNDDILNAGAVTYFGNLAAAVLAGFTDAGGNVWVPSIVSRSLSQLQINPTTVFYSDCNAVLVNKRIGRLKRREARSKY